MIKFRLSIVLLCVILPPLIYVSIIHFIEQYAKNEIRTGLEATYLGDTHLLLDGSARLRQTIRKNIDHYLQECQWLKLGGKVTVSVRTRRNTLLYPLVHDGSNPMLGNQEMPFEIATENFRLIDEGIELSLVFELPHNTAISNSLLAALILLSLTVFVFYYRRWSSMYHQQEKIHSAEIAELNRLKTNHRFQLDRIKKEREMMENDIVQLKSVLRNEKRRADTNEEEMIGEIIALEKNIAKKENLHAVQSEKIEQLQLKLQEFNQLNRKESALKQKSTDMARKRLTTLYKNLDIHDKAVEGYCGLTEELKLKCEEILMQLNEKPTSIQIKRKVFTKRNRFSVLEVVFGYKGRLYFFPKGDRRAELVIIGTKNSQQHDLAYLDRI